MEYQIVMDGMRNSGELRRLPGRRQFQIALHEFVPDLAGKMVTDILAGKCARNKSGREASRRVTSYTGNGNIVQETVASDGSEFPSLRERRTGCAG